MRLLVAIVQDADASGLSKALSKAGYSATKLASTGSSLREGNVIFLIWCNIFIQLSSVGDIMAPGG